MRGRGVCVPCFPDANQTFHLFDKKGNGTVYTKDLGAVFKSLGLQVQDEKLKFWADEADEEGEFKFQMHFRMIMTTVESSRNGESGGGDSRVVVVVVVVVVVAVVEVV